MENNYIPFFELKKSLTFTYDDETVVVLKSDKNYEQIKKAVLETDRKYLDALRTSIKQKKIKTILKL